MLKLISFKLKIKRLKMTNASQPPNTFGLQKPYWFAKTILMVQSRLSLVCKTAIFFGFKNRQLCKQSGDDLFVLISQY